MPKSFVVDTGGTLETSLLAYWRCNEASGNLIDEVDPANGDLTDTNTVTAGASVNSTRLTTRLFTAANSERFTHASSSLFERGVTTYSWACWYKTTTVAADEDDIISKYTASANRQYIIFRNGDDIVYTAYIGDFGSVTKADVLATNTWIFIACGYDSVANEVWISTNNGTVTTDAIVGTGVQGSTGEFNIGAFLEGGSYFNFIDGEVDEVGFWSKRLSADELTDLYNGGTGNTYKEDVVVGGAPSMMLMGIGG